MGFRTLVYQIMDVDAVFFSGAAARPSLPGKSARCGFCQAAWDPTEHHAVEPSLWIACGQIAGMDPEGDWLCERHMEYWYCGACSIQLPEFCGPGTDPLCARCEEDIYADE
jgi:hypothetical protein